MEVNDIIKPENLVYGKPRLMNENPMHYCPGCSHGVIHKLIAEVKKKMERAAAELNFEAAAELRDKMIELKKFRNENDG